MIDDETQGKKNIFHFFNRLIINHPPSNTFSGTSTVLVQKVPERTSTVCIQYVQVYTYSYCTVSIDYSYSSTDIPKDTGTYIQVPVRTRTVRFVLCSTVPST